MNRKMRVLVVDDHRAPTASRVFSARVVTKFSSSTGGEAIEAAALFRPQVVILDLMMRSVDGFRTLAELKRQSWAARAVFVAYTGVSEINTAELALAAGFQYFIRKPVHFEQLQVILVSVRAASLQVQLSNASNAFYASKLMLDMLIDAKPAWREQVVRSDQLLASSYESLRALNNVSHALDALLMSAAPAFGRGDHEVQHAS